jgi:hypothetical protein
MRRSTKVTCLLLTLGASASGALAAECSNGDSPLPAIPPGGTMLVSPCLYTFPVVPDTDGAVPPSAIFVVQGRGSGGLGADSVPVTVSVGPCQDGGGLLTDASSGSVEGKSANTESLDASIMSCEGVYQTSLPPVWDRSIRLEAVDDGGCAELSSRLLQCTLSANGVARFTVQAVLPMLSTEGAAIPICVSALPPNAEREIALLIADSLDGGLIEPQVPEIPMEAVDGSCGAALIDCQNLVRQAPVSAILEEEKSNALIFAQQPLSGNATVRPGSQGVWLSQGACDATDGEPPSAPFLFSSGATSASIGNICVSENRDANTPYLITTTSVSQPNLEGGSATMGIAGQPAKIVLQDAGSNLLTASVIDCQGQAIATRRVSVSGGGSEIAPDGGISVTLVRSGLGSSLEVQYQRASCVQTLEPVGSDP